MRPWSRRHVPDASQTDRPIGAVRHAGRGQLRNRGLDNVGRHRRTDRRADSLDSTADLH
jgi:hypothetical protein